MFRRREDGTEELITEGEAASPAAPASSAPASAPAQAAAAPVSQPTFRPVPPQAAMAARSMPAAAQAASSSESARPSSPAPAAARPSPAVGGNKRVLTVGPDILMKGEIGSCDRVVIEGTVDASMRDVHTVEISESGGLKGTADVEDAEISGTFEGDLVVRGKLTVYASGRVRGNVTYGEIEIQRGGQISGNIRNAADAKTAAVPLGKKAA